MIYFRQIIICLLVLLVNSCDSQPRIDFDKPYPVTESEVLNDFIKNASVQLINLDSIRTEKIVLGDKDIIFYSGSLSGQDYIGFMQKFIAVNNNIYAFNFDQNNIVAIGYDGTYLGPVTRNGRGPGELEGFMGGMGHNSNSIFLTDANNARINIYDSAFNFKHSVSDIRVKDIKVNDSLIVYNRFSTEYQGFQTSGLVTIAGIDSPLDSVSKIMPKIIPDGYEPRIFNDVNYSINNKNEIAASYSYLPWISVFSKSFELERTLILEDSDFQKRNLLPLKIEKINTSYKKGIGGQSVITRFEILDNGDLVILDKGIIYLKRLKDRSYEAVAKYLIEYPESEKTFWVDQIKLIDNNHLIASNWYYIFNIELPDV